MGCVYLLLVRYVYCINYRYQQMSHLQKSIVITLLSIYNWPAEPKQVRYSFIFYSVATEAVLLKKSISTNIVNHQLLINSSLRVSYTSQENQLLLIMYKEEDEGRGDNEGNEGGDDVYNEFVINLDKLNENKVQYLPFKKNDKVLKIVEGSHQDEDKVKWNEINRKMGKGNEKFIKEKQQFLRRINVRQTNSVNERKGGDLKVTFIQNLWNLLQQVQYIRSRNRALSQGADVGQLTNGLYDSIKEQTQEQSQNNARKHEKSHSEGDLKSPNNSSLKLNLPTKYKIYPKYKLNIKDLSIQPYDISQVQNEQQQQWDSRERQQQVYNYFQNEDDVMREEEQFCNGQEQQ